MLATLLAFSAASTPVLAGYLPAWQTADYDFQRLAPLTDVLYFSAEPTAEGALDQTNLETEDLPRLAAAKKKMKFRLLLCVGGWERGAGFFPTATNPAKLDRFVQEVDEFLRKHDFDGVDLDWEHPKNAEEADAYGTMIHALGKRLHPQKKIVTAAIASWQSMSKSAVDGLDRVHVMSYDHPERHATMALAQSDVAATLRMGFPAEKIVLGAPIYGRSVTEWNQQKEYRELMQSLSPKPSEDEAGGYYFNGVNTISAKGEWVRKQKLAGMFFWEVTQDTDGSTSLVAAARKALGLR